MALDFKVYKRGTVVLAAGGTGGHLFPAQALGETLGERGYAVHLMTDGRGIEFGVRFPAVLRHEIPSATITPSKPWKVPLQLLKLVNGYRMAHEIMSQLPGGLPVAVVGFGGYPSLPPLLAAARLGIPIVLHEQNAVMGRANRAMARFAARIASSFPKIVNLDPASADKLVHTGNPVRGIVMEQWDMPFEQPAADEPFHLLVFGGSQGAHYFSELMPKVVAELPNAVRRKLRLVQQCRPEDLEATQAAYDALGQKVTLAPFFADLPKHIASSHLVICRAGASTISELAVIGRPAILVPLPHSLENDQLRNAESFARAGAGWVMEQADITADGLAAFLTRLRYETGDLVAASNAARAFARPDAADRLAAVVEELAISRNPKAAIEQPKQETQERKWI
jgi:UDP-N-acetylglucosamine--N-acetylmuramyl-(pentapeptide) pyrophosphoryl-undecaprenol N-acetylglucosamine transferase